MNHTYIYVKKLPNGLLYLGKTEKDPYDYLGSGTRWRNSIKYHKYTKENIQTWILHETQNKQDLINMGRYYSKIFNIVESYMWANLKVEEGNGGSVGIGKLNPFYGKKHTQKTLDLLRKKCSGTNHPMHGIKNPEASERWKKNNPSTRPELKEKMRQSKLGKMHCRKISKYDKLGNFIESYDSIIEASKINNISAPNISENCSGKRKSAGSFIWKYYY